MMALLDTTIMNIISLNKFHSARDFNVYVVTVYLHNFIVVSLSGCDVSFQVKRLPGIIGACPSLSKVVPVSFKIHFQKGRLKGAEKLSINSKESLALRLTFLRKLYAVLAGASHMLLVETNDRFIIMSYILHGWKVFTFSRSVL